MAERWRRYWYQVNCIQFVKHLLRKSINNLFHDLSNLDSRYRIIGTGSLHIAKPEDTDSGNYQCRASNSIDSSDIQVSLQVQVPPSFTQTPSDRIAVEKEELELLCSVNGKPTPIIQWLKNGDVITPNEYMQIIGGYVRSFHFMKWFIQ